MLAGGRRTRALGRSTIVVVGLLVAGGCGRALKGAGPDGGAGAGAGGTPDGGTSDTGTTVDRASEGTPEAGDAAMAASVPDWVPIRFLTNYQYDRVVKDLLGVDGHAVATFQPTPGDFDVSHDLAVNDARYEQWFNNAQTVAAAAFADPALRARVVTCQPTGTADTVCTRAIVSAFGLRAWRRPLAAEDADELVKLATSVVAGGGSFADGIQTAVTALLSSAPFLFRMELDPDPAAKAPRALTGHELASRLSFLVWSSIPDARLFQLAGDGTLLKDDVLRAEVDRLVDDARAQAFVESFGGSWLGVTEIGGKAIDRPDWDQLQRSMSAELLLYFNEFLRGDRSFTELPNADVNFVDARLAAHYDMSTSGRGAAFERVTVTNDARRGYLGLAAALTVASTSDRAPPTSRGKWILSRLLCAPPQDPPFDTPDGPRRLAPGETNRSRVDAIQKNAACAGCHREMDGIGMALESFDTTGGFHATGPDGQPIDDRGALANGTPIKGQQALADAVAHDRRFLPCAARQAMRFALARELDADDEPAIANVVARWTRGVPTLRALLEEIVLDDSFRQRRPEGAP